MSDMSSTKPFAIAKRSVWEAYQQVKANRGAAGVDEETIAMFEQDLSKNLYKLWNRMSSGSYFPPPVKQVEIPKAKGGTRKLGIPTVSDRIAQTVVKRIIEPLLDPIFHLDSYGYRPGRSAKQAIAVTRKRCWQYDWVVEFDIKAAFDQVDHGLLFKAVCIPACTFHISAEKGHKQYAPDIHQFPAGCKCRCLEEDEGGSARVEAESSDACGACCVGQAIQPDHLRVVELLWGVLSDSDARSLHAHRPCA